MEMNCREILAAVRGKLVQAKELDTNIRRLTIDSREVEAGDFFIPLAGEKSDGHHYLADAARRGAAGCFVASGRKNEAPDNITVIMVEDPLRSLQLLASVYRDRFTLPVVAVTGSTGKTTTKDLIAATLSGRLFALKTEGNLNNQIGLPLMLSRLAKKHTAAVLEMGMSGPGEIAFLAELARPNVGVITNIGESHLEMLCTRENIAKAKCELLPFLREQGCAILNADEPLLTPYFKNIGSKLVTYGFSNQAALRCTAVKGRGREKAASFEQDGYETLELAVPLPGRHNIYNLMAAVAVARELGLDNSEIARGLRNLELTAMRLEMVMIAAGYTVINDAYNASPTSMAAALDVLAEEAGGAKKIVVLGDMLELGGLESEGHMGIGRLVAAGSIYALVLLGKRARLIGEGAREAGYPADRIYYCETHEEAAGRVRELTGAGDWVLLKGSRGMRMEEILSLLSASREE